MRRLLPLLLLAATVAADSWLPFGERQWTSPDGTYRLTGHDDKGRFVFELSEGRAKVIARGKLAQLPLDVHVLSGEPAAVLFDQYARVGHGVTLALLDRAGKLRWALPLEQAIPGGAKGAKASVSSLWWSRAWWVDEPRGKVVLVALNGTMAEVDLAKGQSTTPAKEVALDALALPWARLKALEVAIEQGAAGLGAVAAPLAADASLPPGVRLRAAVAVEHDGGDPVPRELWDAALGDDVSDEARRESVKFAGRYIANVALVEKAALRKDVGYQAIIALGERGAAKSLAGLVTHGAIDPGVRAYAAQTLGRQSPDDVLAAIDKEMKDADAEQGGALLNAAIATGAPGLEARLQHHEAVLLRILDRQTGDIGWLADYFKGRPTSEAVKPLLKALAARRSHPVLKDKLIGALKTCSGEDHGDDANAWLRELGRR